MYSRLKTLSYEKSFAHAERLERLHPKVIDDIGSLSLLNLTTSSAVKCWASANEPPFPQDKIEPSAWILS